MSWDCYCVVCGGPLIKLTQASLDFHNDEDYQAPKIEPATYEWLSELVVLPKDDFPFHASPKDYQGAGVYKVGGDSYTISSKKWGDKRDKITNAMMAHENCVRLIKDEFDVKLNYKFILPKITDHTLNLLPQSKYLEMGPYISQYQDSFGMFLNEEQWLLEWKDKNMIRIVEIWEILV